ncbi:MAG TPA: cytosine permease [Steroidobacteraceae bacterium]|nr:cytosine permease [Steroidobacteraceae bacterium]
MAYRFGSDGADDFSRAPVPEAATIGPVRIVLIVLAVSIALPTFLMGAQLGLNLGLRDTVIACTLGGVVLGGVAALSAIAGARSRVSSYMLIAAAFGRAGGNFVNLALGLCVLGWFGVIAMMFGSTLRQMVVQTLPQVGVSAWAICGGAVFTLTTIVGFKAIDRLSIVLTPLKLALLLCAVVVAVRKHGGLPAWHGTQHAWPTVSSFVSFVVGGLAGGASLTPDLCRYARTPAQAAAASSLAYGVGFPVILVLSAIPAILTRQSDLVLIMVQLGLGAAALSIVVLAAWTTDAYNLYVGSLTLAAVFSRPPRWLLTVIAGILGTVFGVAGLSERVVPFLVLLSVAVPPIAGVYLSHFYLERWRGRPVELAGSEVERRWRLTAFVAWGVGFGVGNWSQELGVRLTTNAALDSLVTSAVAYLAMSLLPAGRGTAARCARPLV